MKSYLKSKNFKLIILIILIGIFTLILLKRVENLIINNNSSDKSEKYPVLLSELPEIKYNPFKGKVIIKPDFDGFYLQRFSGTEEDPIINKRNFIAFRKKKVNQYNRLNFYYPYYSPFKFFHKQIYKNIRFDKDFLDPTKYFIANPYQLIIFTKADHVTPLNIINKFFKLTYNNGVITELYKDTPARNWMSEVFTFSDHPGKIWAIMINAWDAGFFYINVDPDKSENILPGQPGNVTATIHSGYYFFHVGHYGVNNLSPSKPNAWITIKEINKFTKIYIKLWRKKPDSIHDKPDLIYQLIIDPK